MPEELTFADVDRIELVELTGERQSDIPPQAIRTQLSAARGILEGTDRKYIRAEIQVEGLRDRDDEESIFPVYNGSAAFLVDLRELVEPDHLIELMWPYLRTNLLDHARRLGISRVALPLVFEGEPVRPDTEEDELR